MERRLANAMHREQAPATVELRASRRRLLGDIAEDPARQRIDQTLATQDVLQQKRPAEKMIVTAVARARGTAPFVTVDCYPREWAVIHELAQKRQVLERRITVANDATVLFRGVIKREIRRIGMGRDEVHRQVFALAESHELLDPCRAIGAVWLRAEVRGGRPADAQRGIHRFHRIDAALVELEIFRLGAFPKNDVGFVPRLEIPGAHFVETVAGHQRLDGSVHHSVPIIEVVGRTPGAIHREDAVVVTRHPGWQETKLHQRPQAKREIVVVVGEEILEIERPVLLVPDEHVVMEHPVLAQVLETTFPHRYAQTLPIVGTQRQAGAVAAYHLLPVWCHRLAGFGAINTL